MFGELALFYILWGIILLSLTSVACLIFMDVEAYQGFLVALFTHFEAALGSWSTTKFCDSEDEFLCNEGRIFMLIFLSINMVLLLNLIIAILSSTYAFFEDKKIGLYYEVLVSKFSVMEFDERYGAAACAQAPLNLMIFPL